MIDEDLELWCGPCRIKVRTVLNNDERKFRVLRKFCDKECLERFVKLISDERNNTTH